MSREHRWKPIYPGADVMGCTECPIQIRRTGESWQHRAWSGAETWLNEPAPKMCFGREGATTEELEAELKAISGRISSDPIRFQQVRDELKRRHDAGGDQPIPIEMTAEQQRQSEVDAFRESNRLLVLKVTEMEAEQARLVVEAELHKQQRVDAEYRLALVVRRLSTKREPMSRDVARELADRHLAKYGMATDVPGMSDWAVDAIVEASR